MGLAVALAVGLPASAALAAQPGSLPARLAATGSAVLPYTDPEQAGLLTLCGPHLRPITHGSITTKPFVWRVVSSVAAPDTFRVKGATATLYAYQPRPYTPAGAWSGSVMGAASYYSNPTHPMAQFTPIDEPLDYFTEAFPPIWKHLIELRLYLAAPGTSQDELGYAAADVRVTGDTWTLVSGGHASCTDGTAVSRETILHLPGASASPIADTSAQPTTTSTATPAPTGSASSAPAASATPASSPSPTASSTHSSSSDAPAVIAAVVAVLAVVAAGWLWRRRRATP
jgi:hypothetical protein